MNQSKGFGKRCSYYSSRMHFRNLVQKFRNSLFYTAMVNLMIVRIPPY